MQKRFNIKCRNSVSSLVAAAVSPTAKPWILTFKPESKDVLIWKNGMRIKMKDGNASGQVNAVSVLSELKETMTVSVFNS